MPLTAIAEYGSSTLDLQPAPMQLSEILSAMTFALDLTEGALPGHTLRSCLLGMRLAETIGLPQGERTALYYALQLKDVGCSSNAARMTALVGGNDHLLKHAAKLQDWTRLHQPSPRVVRFQAPRFPADSCAWQRLPERSTRTIAT